MLHNFRKMQFIEDGRKSEQKPNIFKDVLSFVSFFQLAQMWTLQTKEIDEMKISLAVFATSQLSLKQNS